MDMSAFPEEQEILLLDGSKFFVVSVEKTEDQHGSPMNLVILKDEDYDSPNLVRNESMYLRQDNIEIGRG